MEFREVVSFLKKNDKYIITGHESPDGDAISAVYALSKTLERLGKTVLPMLSDPVTEKYRFIDPHYYIQLFMENESLPDSLSEHILIVLDTIPQNTGLLMSYVVPAVHTVLVIDHHDSSELVENARILSFLDPESSSTCEMLYPIIKEIDPGMDFPVAFALFAGIVYDTGSFVYPKTTALTFHIAEELVKQGVSPNIVYSALYESKSTASLMLQSGVQQTLELFSGNRIAYQVMTRKLLEETGAHYDEGHEIINIPLQCKDIRVSIFLKEDESGIKRCSLRSKGEINCAAIASRFEGGGHKTAAGFKFSESFDNIKRTLLDIIKALLP